MNIIRPTRNLPAGKALIVLTMAAISLVNALFQLAVLSSSMSTLGGSEVDVPL
ncbi:MAG: hypothetical protein ACD_23C00225G0002 [uncultured bacterium]|nr:MAG: hypothetical protein ACD_23C00225G0002 [uncultured bacterium]